MIEDAQLLRRYVEEKSESAFAELVRRRVNLVYSVALRQVGGDAHLAEDVTQKVFADLARKAATLTTRPVLSGWLYRSTQFAASDVVRSERRRRAREQESQAMHETSTPPTSPPDWDKLRPLLDEAMNELNDDDRDAVALRFFEGQPFAEIGRTLRLTEEAARKRVDRALDKMGAVLSRRGVTSTSAAVGLALANQALVAAPAGLAASVTGTALAGAAAASAGAAGWGAFAWFNSAKVSSTLGVAAVVATGAAIYQGKSAQESSGALAAMHSEQQQTRTQVAALEQRLLASEQRAKAAEADNSELLSAIEALRTARAAPASAALVTAASGTTADVTEPEGPITIEAVDARYKRAQELARAGHGTEALKEFLWLFDRGMPAHSRYTGVRRSFLLSEIIRSGEAGRAALIERRNAAEKRVLEELSRDAAADVAALNRTLKEDDRTLALYDQLPADDPRRRSMGTMIYEQLLSAQRYSDAVGVRSYDQMLQHWDSNTRERPVPPNAVDPERMRQMMRTHAIQTAARNVEALAGAGDIANARDLVTRIAAFDGSEQTRALLKKHAERAGKPDLLRGLPGM